MSQSRTGLRVVGATALVGAMGLAGWTARPVSPGFDVDGFTHTVDSRLREASAGLHTRVSTLAELPRLAVAVATDARTVGDLTQDELAFRPHPGETIAIGQIPKAAATKVAKPSDKAADKAADKEKAPAKTGHGPVVLLLAPRGAARPSFELNGLQLHLVGDTLVAAEAVRVAPRERAAEVDGVIAVSWVVDLAPVMELLSGTNVQAQLAVEGGTLTLGALQPPPGARRHQARLAGSATSGGTTVGKTGVELTVLSAPPPRPSPWLWGGVAGLAVLGAAAFGLRRRTPITDVPAPLWAPASGPNQSAPNLTAPTPVSRTRITGPVPGPITAAIGRAPPLGVPEIAIGRIGRYELLQKIGSGGMAEVYLARATGEAGFAKLVALKVLLPDFASQPQVVEHFLDEARLAAQLYHPNIVQTADLGKAGDHYFMAMEFVDGTDLLRLIGLSQSRRKPVPVSVALAILREICAGLQAAHEACEPDGHPLDLVHRDVKSANVFVARTGVVKVGDFGIARANHAGWVRRTENGMVKGTPGYMSPEHRLGQAIDARADLYGVGAIAYELLTGQPINLDLALLAAKGREGWPHLPALTSVRPDVPKELQAIVMRALAFDKDDRFPSCAALEQAFEAVAVVHPPVAGDKAVARWFDDLVAGEPRLAEPTTTASVALGR